MKKDTVLAYAIISVLAPLGAYFIVFFPSQDHALKAGELALLLISNVTGLVFSLLALSRTGSGPLTAPARIIAVPLSAVSLVANVIAFEIILLERIFRQATGL